MGGGRKSLKIVHPLLTAAGSECTILNRDGENYSPRPLAFWRQVQKTDPPGNEGKAMHESDYMGCDELPVEDQIILMQMMRDGERDLPSREQFEAGGLEFSVVAAAGVPGGGKANSRKHTFRIDRKVDGDKCRYFVDYKLRHSDQWVYIGMYEPHGSISEEDFLVLTKGSRMGDDDTPVRLFRWLALRVAWCDGHFQLPEGYTCEWAEKPASLAGGACA